MGKVTIGDVAREAGVALGTVSNALNHPEKVRPETLKLVNAAIVKLGYAPNQSARLLAGGKNPTIGLVIPRLDHGLSLQVAHGAGVEAERAGYGLVLASAEGDIEREASYARYFAGTQLSGILIQHVAQDDGPLPVQHGSTPIAYVNVRSDAPGYFVATDNAAQGALIAEHAALRGSRRVAVIGALQTPQMRERLEGLTRTMEKYPDIALDVLEEGDGSSASDGYGLARTLVDRGASRPDFIVGLSDVLAVGAVAGVQACGLAVPDDIAVSGCDGNPLAWGGTVPLTSCSPTGYEMGRRGVKLLIEQIELARSDATALARELAENHQELVRPFMLMRASTLGEDAPVSAMDISGLNLGAYL